MEISQILNRLVEKKDLSAQDASTLLEGIMNGSVTPVQAGAVLTALRMKEETADEIYGFIKTMRVKMRTIKAPGAIDIVGTGGGGVDPFNISTAAAFVARGAGAKVAKHGNRAASSKCGSADVLEALGVKIDLSPQQAQAVFDKIGMIFLFAPLYHPSMKQVVAVRRELKIRTIFNVLGPFTNPAATKRQLTGVPNMKNAERLAAVSMRLGYEHLLIVTSDDGMDELSTYTKAHVFEVRGKKLKKMTIDPQKLGFKRPPRNALNSGMKGENAALIQSILEGNKGPDRDVVILNAGAALYVAGIANTIKDGLALAEESIGRGRAKKALSDLVLETNQA